MHCFTPTDMAFAAIIAAALGSIGTILTLYRKIP